MTALNNALTYRIKLAADTIERDELNLLCEWIRGGNQLTKGPLTPQFERSIAEFLGGGYVTFVNSGSSANLLALSALDLDRVNPRRVAVVPAISWVTTVTPAMQLGYEVVLCDCDEDTLGLDPNHFEHLCEQHKPSVAFVVDVLGHPNRYEDIRAVAQRYNVTLIEDACEAFGTKVGNRRLGTFGTFGTFSFYFGHQISTIEGGAVWVNDRQTNNVVRSLRAHGWARDIDVDIKRAWESEFDIDEFRSLYSFYFPGYNFRSTDLNAFLGLSQLRKVDLIVKRRQENFELYRRGLGDAFWTQSSESELLCSFAFGTVVANRLEVYGHLKRCGIESRPLICGNIGRQPFWIKKYGVTALPRADIIHECGMYLPNHVSMTPVEIEEVISEFRRVAIPHSSYGKGLDVG